MYPFCFLTEGELEQQQTEAKNVERNISQFRNDMVKLNTFVAKKKSEQESLEQGNLLMEGDFVHALKVCSRITHTQNTHTQNTHTHTLYVFISFIGSGIGVNTNAEQS